MTEKYGFISSTGQIYDSVKDGCAFMEIPYDVNKYEIAFRFAKHFPYTDLFNHFISKHFENGNLNRIKSQFVKESNNKCDTNSQLDSMGFDNVISAFFMFVVGLVLTVIVLCIEFCLARVEKTQKLRQLVSGTLTVFQKPTVQPKLEDSAIIVNVKQ